MLECCSGPTAELCMHNLGGMCVATDWHRPDARPVITDNVTSVRIQLESGDGGLAVD